MKAVRAVLLDLRGTLLDVTSRWQLTDHERIRSLRTFNAERSDAELRTVLGEAVADANKHAGRGRRFFDRIASCSSAWPRSSGWRFGAILGTAIPLARALSETWQFGILARAARSPLHPAPVLPFQRIPRRRARSYLRTTYDLRNPERCETMTHIAHRAGLTAALAAAALLSVIATAAAAGGPSSGASPNPTAYPTFLVYIANGTFNPGDTNYKAPDGIFFQKTIMHRTDAQIEEQRAKALAFFKERFGADPANGDASVGFSMLDPRMNYRAHVIGGQYVSPKGFVIRDGGFNLVTTKDTVFHGTYGGAAGKPVAAGTSITFGDYNILRTTAGGKELKPLIIHYQSALPIAPANSDGIRTFRCELIDPTSGAHGIAQGVIAPPRDAGNGKIQVSIRNVITFPGY